MMLHRIFWPVYVILAIVGLLFSTGAMGQEKLKEGDTRTGVVAVCEEMSDAATLIGITTRYGRNTAMGWMQEEDNTCAMVPITFIVGTVEMADIKDKQGVVWSVLGVTVENVQHYIVIPSAMVATPTSY